MDAARALALLECALTASDFAAYRDALILLRQRPNLSNEQFRSAVAAWLVLHDIAPERPLIPRQRLDFSLFSTQKFMKYFRFLPHDIPILRQALGIDNVVITADHHRILGDDALLLLLRRMASPQRLVDMEDEFALGSSTISTITLSLLRSLWNRWYALLFCADYCWTQERLALYAQAVSEKVQLLTGHPWPGDIGWYIAAFLDGSFHYTDQPGDDFRGQNLQESAYSGYYKSHGLRFHHLLFPDGILGHISLFIAGRLNDARLWHESLYVLWLVQPPPPPLALISL